MDIELKRLEELEEKYDIEIYIESNLDANVDKYFYKKNKDDKFVYVSHNIDMLEKYLLNKRERGEL